MNVCTRFNKDSDLTRSIVRCVCKNSYNIDCACVSVSLTRQVDPIPDYFRPVNIVNHFLPLI